MTTAKEVLIKARELIAEPEHWCQGWYAKDKEGEQIVSENDSRAQMWCSIGAIRKVLLDERGITSATYVELKEDAIAALANCEEPDVSDYPEDTVVNFNDEHEHEDVLKAFDCAISKL